MRCLDVMFGMLLDRPRFFADGWGDLRVIDDDPVALTRHAPVKVAISWGAPRRSRSGTVREGIFDSPETRLPACSRRARVQLALPAGPLRGVALHLAATGDQGFRMRLRIAGPLLERGIGALVLENALYGSRRPPRQLGPAVRTVSDLYLMAAATLQEGRALLRWLYEGPFGAVGVTGYSMGGQMAAMVGATVPFPVAVIPVAPTCAPDSVLRSGAMCNVASWAALAVRGEDTTAVRDLLCARLARYSVARLPPPVRPEAAIVVGTELDAIVPPAEMRRIAEHWGCELRWLPASHVSAIIRHQGAFRHAIVDAFDRIALGTTPGPTGFAGTSGAARSRSASTSVHAR
jgi:predicted alpha/beta-hydrolase family hydrolase